MEPNFSDAEDLRSKIINHIEFNVESFRARTFEGESDDMSTVAVRTSDLFVQEDAVDEEAVNLFVES